MHSGNKRKGAKQISDLRVYQPFESYFIFSNLLSNLKTL